MSANGSSVDVGNSETSVGDFTDLQLEINKNLAADGYPSNWTQYTISNLPTSGTGRIAFRYYVTGASTNIENDDNSDYIGIDRVVYSVQAPPVPVRSPIAAPVNHPLALILLSLSLYFLARRYGFKRC